MDDLVAFLRAQLDDDERAAKRVEPNQAPINLRAMVTRDGSPPFLVIDSARVLAEVDAKRRRIEHYLQVCEYADPAKHPAQEYVLAKGAVERSLMFDALPYAEREGFRAEWTVATEGAGTI